MTLGMAFPRPFGDRDAGIGTSPDRRTRPRGSARSVADHARRQMHARSIPQPGCPAAGGGPDSGPPFAVAPADLPAQHHVRLDHLPRTVQVASPSAACTAGPRAACPPGPSTGSRAPSRRGRRCPSMPSRFFEITQASRGRWLTRRISSLGIIARRRRPARPSSSATHAIMICDVVSTSNRGMAGPFPEKWRWCLGQVGRRAPVGEHAGYLGS